MISTSPAKGACMDAPIIAAAPIKANAPTGDPGHILIHTAPRNAPNVAPVAMNGVNTPPAVPLPNVVAVTNGFKAKSAKKAAAAFKKLSKKLLKLKKEME